MAQLLNQPLNKPVRQFEGVAGKQATSPVADPMRDFIDVQAGSISKSQFWATAGLEYVGKSRFALTFPEPIAYLATDPRYVQAMQEFAGKKKILLKQFLLPDLIQKENATRLDPATNKPRQEAVIDPVAYRELWDDWHATWLAVLESAAVRTIVVDSGKDVWDIFRGARMGSLTKTFGDNFMQAYNRLNLEFEAIIRKGTQAYGCDKDIVWIEKMKKQYVKEKGEKEGNWNGKYETAGFGNIGYVADVKIVHFSEGGVFGIRMMDKAGTAPGLVGMEWREQPAEHQIYGVDSSVGILNYDFIMGQIQMMSANPGV